MLVKLPLTLNNIGCSKSFIIFFRGLCRKTNATTWRKCIILQKSPQSLIHTLQGLNVSSPCDVEHVSVSSQVLCSASGVTGGMMFMFHCFRMFRSSGHQGMQTLSLMYPTRKKSQHVRSQDIRGHLQWPLESVKELSEHVVYSCKARDTKTVLLL